ncbi:MAG: aminotransferase class I/II-fold pyridoxal phosphate-dependent enzyme [Elusimicrobiota bacterium]
MAQTAAYFGQDVLKEAQRLKEAGRDANQIANILCQKDPEGHNYGIGIILGGDGRPVESSATLTAYAKKEIEASARGSYMNSAKILPAFKEEVLRWQRIPEAHWEDLIVAIPSDAGTGAVCSAVQFAAMADPSLGTLAIERLGWPAYTAIAKAARLGVKEFPSQGVVEERDVLPIYQAGPMNSTGEIPRRPGVEARAEQAASSGRLVVLDRAYSGFEYARNMDVVGYDGAMRRSYELQLEPFFRKKAPFALALSPTKAFVTFALRPCGVLLVHEPDPEKRGQAGVLLTALIRSRGSAFEHPLTRAFVKAMAESRASLEKEHEAALRRVAEAEASWRRLAAGTPLAPHFTDRFAGLFRNLESSAEAPARLYQKHLYPVFPGGRCRLNVTGLPSDESLARRHVDAFAEACS